MKSKIIRVGTSLGLIIPAALAKDINLQIGTQIEVTENSNKELVVKKVTNVRQGWAEAFKKYAQNEQELLIPDYLLKEAEAYL